MSVTAASAGAWIAAGIGAAMAHGCFVPRSRLLAPVISCGDRGSRCVALTFDDGPGEGTAAVLDVLGREGVKAAFFVIGANVARRRELVRRMDREGHLVANHTQDHHEWGMFRATRYWREQAERAEEEVARAIGRRPALFRPPMGFKQPLVWRGVRGDAGAERRMVTWSRRGFDGVRTTARGIERRLLRGVRGGDVLLLHDGAAPGRERDARATVEALPRVIAGLRGGGLEIVRVDELLGVAGYL